MTIPYVTGTVSVTAGSAVVTGTGTAWATALIAGGLFGLDSSNGNPVPILSVDSDTQIALAKPWRGTTAAGQGYWIVRDTAYLQQQTVNAQALSTYIQRLDNATLTALAGLTPAADKFAFFTGAASGALTGLSAFARTLLDDANAAAFYATLGELPSAQTPDRLKGAPPTILTDANDALDSGFYRASASTVNIPEGAQGAIIVSQVLPGSVTQIYIRSSSGRVYSRTSIAGTWGGWVRQVGFSDILGSVSQSGGVPTGSIIERGSNANGEYVRFADGTQLCWKVNAVTSGPVDNPTGNLWVSALVSWTFPISFLGSANSMAHRAGSSSRWTSGVGTTSTAASIRVFSTASNTSDLGVDMVAIGRWF